MTALHCKNVCFGNLWFLDCAFADVILSRLKHGKEQKTLVRSKTKENPRFAACARFVGIVLLCFLA
jgi:hypothetical protein